VIKDSLLSFVGILRRYIQVRFQIKRSAATKIASTLYPTVDEMSKTSLDSYKSKIKRKACKLVKEIAALEPIQGDNRPDVVEKIAQLRDCERLLLTPCKFSMLVTF
jgi:hypothetical protein